MRLRKVYPEKKGIDSGPIYMESNQNRVSYTCYIYGYWQMISKARYEVPLGGLPHPSESPTLIPPTGHPCIWFESTIPQPC